MCLSRARVLATLQNFQNTPGYTLNIIVSVALVQLIQSAVVAHQQKNRHRLSS